MKWKDRTGLMYLKWKRILYREDGTKRAVAIIILVCLNVAIWCVAELIGDTLDGFYILQCGGMYPELLISNGEWYRLFTAMFLHFGAQHLANNMIILAATGDKLEKAVGWFYCLIIYLGAGLTGNLLSLYMMMKTQDYAISAGASGAVFGIIGALVWVAIRNRGRFEGLTTKGLVLMIALCLYHGITAAGVDNWAHIGGAFGGFCLCILFYRKRQNA